MMSITRELLKQEIDHIQDQYIDALYMVIKAFEYLPIRNVPPYSPPTDAEWHRFLDKFAGSCSDAPLQRGEQGDYEVREPLR